MNQCNLCAVLLGYEDDFDLQKRIALALHDTPGFHDGCSSPWIAAKQVIEELRKAPAPREETP